MNPKIEKLKAERSRLGFSIHDYFFAKTLDQVRPGGVIDFVTSLYTMDKQSPEVRRYIAQRAELLGAIRLPSRNSRLSRTPFPSGYGETRTDGRSL